MMKGKKKLIFAAGFCLIAVAIVVTAVCLFHREKPSDKVVDATSAMEISETEKSTDAAQRYADYIGNILVQELKDFYEFTSVQIGVDVSEESKTAVVTLIYEIEKELTQEEKEHMITMVQTEFSSYDTVKVELRNQYWDDFNNRLAQILKDSFELADTQVSTAVSADAKAVVVTLVYEKETELTQEDETFIVSYIRTNLSLYDTVDVEIKNQ